jgi:hypothetical protein
MELETRMKIIEALSEEYDLLDVMTDIVGEEVPRGLNWNVVCALEGNKRWGILDLDIWLAMLTIKCMGNLSTPTLWWALLCIVWLQ